MARVTIISPEGRQEHPLLPHNTIGRHPNNTLQVLDRIVSKEHCHIDLVNTSYVLHDLGSLNGTFVNGKRVNSHTLTDGDEITLGATRILFASTQQTQAQQQAHTRPLVSSASKVTISPGAVESQIRSKLAPLLNQAFLPVKLVREDEDLRHDYERLRASYEVIQAIGVELDVDKMLTKILDCAFHLLAADRGVVLLYSEEDEKAQQNRHPESAHPAIYTDQDRRTLSVRCLRTRMGREEEAVLLSSTIIHEVLRDKAAVLSSDASVDSRFQGAHSVIIQGIRSTMAVPLLHSNEVFGIMVLDSQIATNAFTEKDLQLFQNMANQAAIALQNSLYAKKLEQEAVTRERFQRLLSPAIAEQVLDGTVAIAKGGEERETTVLFTDIRGFTAMSEAHAASDIVDMLNEYFERMVEIIFRHEGTLDKFIGDEIMALFGAPVTRPDDPVRAVQTALEMLTALETFNREQRFGALEPISVGIGINTGEVVAGYLGSSKALEYTVVGDTVNTGARLCSLAKANEILISEDTYTQVKDDFVIDALAPVRLKGKAKAQQIYRVRAAITS